MLQADVPLKQYDSKDGSPNKPLCLPQVMRSRKIDKVKRSPRSNVHDLFRRNKTPPSPKKVYTSKKYLYFCLKDSPSNCQYFGFVVGLSFFPHLRTCTKLECLRRHSPYTVPPTAFNRQFGEGSKGRTYLEPLLQPCD